MLIHVKYRPELCVYMSSINMCMQIHCYLLTNFSCHALATGLIPDHLRQLRDGLEPKTDNLVQDAFFMSNLTILKAE